MHLKSKHQYQGKLYTHQMFFNTILFLVFKKYTQNVLFGEINIMYFFIQYIIYCFALRKISIVAFNIIGFFWINIITARIFRLNFLIFGCTNLTHVTLQSYSFKLTTHFVCVRSL